MHLGIEFVMLSFDGKICKEHSMPLVFMGCCDFSWDLHFMLFFFFIVVNDALDTLSSLNNIPT
jgi:hypothetical protein